MPIRAGFSEFRKKMLEQTLEKLTEIFPQLGLVQVILVGDMASGDYAPDTSIELIVVQETDLKFGRRADFFSYHLDTPVEVQRRVKFSPRYRRRQESDGGGRSARSTHTFPSIVPADYSDSRSRWDGSLEPPGRHAAH